MSLKVEPIGKSGRKASKPSKRYLASVRILENFVFNDSNAISPADIRKKLPHNLREIQSSDLTHILTFLTRLKIFSKADRIRRKRGRKTASEDDLAPGIKSFYEQSRYFQIIKKMISDKYARCLIFFFLLQSGLIHQYLYHILSFIMYIVKFDENGLNPINITNLNEERKDSKHFRELFLSEDDISVKKIIDYLAATISKEMSMKIEDDDPILIHLYLIGGVYFYLP
jgi:hypothetical protein